MGTRRRLLKGRGSRERGFSVCVLRASVQLPVSMLNLRFVADAEALLQVGARAEHAAVAGHDDAFHAVVDAEEGEDLFELQHHGFGEGIVVLRTVESEDYDGRGVW